MAKTMHNWNDDLEESDEEEDNFYMYKEITPFVEVFALEFVDFGGRDHAEICGTIKVIDVPHTHTIFKSDGSQRISLGRFESLSGGNCSRGVLPINAQGDVLIKLDLADKTYGNLVFESIAEVQKVEMLREEVKFELLEREGESDRDNYIKDFELWNGNQSIWYDKLLSQTLVNPYCTVKVIYAVYGFGRAATVQVTFVGWKGIEDSTTTGGAAAVYGKVTAHNTVLNDLDACSMLFNKMSCDNSEHEHGCVRVVPGDVIPLSKPIVVVPAKSSLLLDINLELHDSGSGLSFAPEAYFQIPAWQSSGNFVFYISSKGGGGAGGATAAATASLRVEVTWLNLKSRTLAHWRKSDVVVPPPPLTLNRCL